MTAEIARLIAGGLLALICCYIGVLIKKRYNARVRFFKSATEFCSMLEDELSMRKTPIPEVITKFLDGRAGEFESYITHRCELSRGRNTGADYKCRLLNNDESKDMDTFLSMLGKTDLKDQLSHVAYYEKVFEKKTEECSEQSKKNGSMYFKLCVLCGLAIIMILA